MAQTTEATGQNRTITVDFQDPSTYFQLISDGKAFVEFVLAFLLSLGFQLAHKATCRGGRCLTRHSHYARVRLGGLTIWRVQCTTCHAEVWQRFAGKWATCGWTRVNSGVERPSLRNSRILTDAPASFIESPVCLPESSALTFS